MNNREQFEREVSVKEIFEYLIGKIKYVLIITLALMLFAGIMGYFLEIREISTGASNGNNKVVLTEEEKSEIDKWLLLKNAIGEEREYIYNSNIMAIPTEVYTITIQYNIICENGSDLGMLYSAYINEYFLNNTMAYNALINAKGEYNNLVIEVVGKDSKELEILKQEVLKIIEEYKCILENLNYSHKMMQVSEMEMQGLSDSLMQLQNSLVQNLQLKEIQLNYMESKFNDNQNLYVDALENGFLEETVKGIPKKSKILFEVFFVGAATFIIGMLILIWYYLTSGRIFVSSEIQKCFGLYHFGTLNNKDVLKKIDLKCKCDNIVQLGIICDSTEKEIDLECKHDLEIVPTLLIDPENNFDELEKMFNVKNIVIKVDLGKTRREKLENIIIMCEKYNINILGTVC